MNVIGVFKDAHDKYLHAFLEGNAEKMAELSGGTLKEDVILLPYYNDTLSVNTQDGTVIPSLNNYVEEFIVYMYLSQAQGVSGPSEEFISFLQLPFGVHHNEPFRWDAITPLENAFGNNVDAFSNAARLLGGYEVKSGDAAFLFRYFPKVWLKVILFLGDDEFPPSVQILFDKRSQFHLDTVGLYGVGIELAKRILYQTGKGNEYTL